MRDKIYTPLTVESAVDARWEIHTYPTCTANSHVITFWKGTTAELAILFIKINVLWIDQVYTNYIFCFYKNDFPWFLICDENLIYVSSYMLCNNLSYLITSIFVILSQTTWKIIVNYIFGPVSLNNLLPVSRSHLHPISLSHSVCLSNTNLCSLEMLLPRSCTRCSSIG